MLDAGELFQERITALGELLQERARGVAPRRWQHVVECGSMVSFFRNGALNRATGEGFQERFIAAW
jgi:hypothetical protein